jgi:hypothetical protein
MSNAEQASKRKRRSKALPVLGAAGLSLSLASTASAVPGGPAVDLPNSGNRDANQVLPNQARTRFAPVCVSPCPESLAIAVAETL